MPYPQNLETAREVEHVIKENGAVPATVAILDGVPCIGIILQMYYTLFRVSMFYLKRGHF